MKKNKNRYIMKCKAGKYEAEKKVSYDARLSKKAALAKAHGPSVNQQISAAYDRAFRELSNSELGYSLTASNIQSASNTPFLPREQYQNITRYMEMKDAVDSQFADLFTQIIQDRVTVDPITAKMLKDKFISEMEAQEKGSGWRKFKNLFQVSRGHLYFDGVNTNQFGVGKGEGLFLGEIVGPDPSITNNIITGQKRVGNKRSLWKFIDDVAGESNQVESKEGGQTIKKCP